MGDLSFDLSTFRAAGVRITRKAMIAAVTLEGLESAMASATKPAIRDQCESAIAGVSEGFVNV